MVKITSIVAKRTGWYGSWKGKGEVLVRSVREAGAGLIDLSKGDALGLM